MPAKLERCVKDLEGKINKRTGKPYTRSERYAICNSSVSSETIEDTMARFDEFKFNAMRRLMLAGKASDSQDAEGQIEGLLAKAGFNFNAIGDIT